MCRDVSEKPRTRCCHSSVGGDRKDLDTATSSLAAGIRERDWVRSWAPSSECDLEQAPLPFWATFSPAVEGRAWTDKLCGPIQLCVHIAQEGWQEMKVWGTDVSKIFRVVGEHIPCQVMSTAPSDWMAPPLLGSVTPDKLLAISVPWLTSLEKGNQSSDTVGFKSTVLLFVHYLPNLLFVCLLLFLCLLLAWVSFMILLCLLCWLINYNSVLYWPCFKDATALWPPLLLIRSQLSVKMLFCHPLCNVSFFFSCFKIFLNFGF